MKTWLVAIGSLRSCGAAGGDAGGEPVGTLGISLPQPGLKIGEQLHGGISPLAQELSGALAAEFEVRDSRRIKKHDGFGIHAAILDDAERQYVDPRLPGELCRGRILRHQRIRKARTIHVHRHAPLMGDLRERCDFRRRVDRAALGGLRNREHTRFHAVHVRLEPAEPRGKVVRSYLCACAAH
jgi:hypothetical protein